MTGGASPSRLGNDAGVALPFSASLLFTGDATQELKKTVIWIQGD